VELGGELKKKKAEREELDKEIAALEEKLRPLVVQHTQLLSDLVGTPPPAATSVAGSDPVVKGSAPINEQLRKRLTDYLAKADPGISAFEIAEALKVDPTLVREVMRDLAKGKV